MQTENEMLARGLALVGLFLVLQGATNDFTKPPQNDGTILDFRSGTPLDYIVAQVDLIARVNILSGQGAPAGYGSLGTCGFYYQARVHAVIKGDHDQFAFFSPVPLSVGRDYLVFAHRLKQHEVLQSIQALDYSLTSQEKLRIRCRTGADWFLPLESPVFFPFAEPELLDISKPVISWCGDLGRINDGLNGLNRMPKDGVLMMTLPFLVAKDLILKASANSPYNSDRTTKRDWKPILCN